MRDGAKVVETADDILEELGFAGDRGRTEGTTRGSGAMAMPDLVLRHMEAGESYDLDALSAFSGLTHAVLTSELVNLELAGLISRSEVGRYRRLRG